MTAETFRDYLHATPFASFTVHLTDGRFFHVDHPDFATVMRDHRHVFINFEGGRHAVVDVQAITHIESAAAKDA